MSELTIDEARSLRCVAGMMIPASSAHSVPGADDNAIFADIVRSIGRDIAHVRQSLARLDALAGATFADCDRARQDLAAVALRHEGGITLTSLTLVIVQCYYRDDRVMRSLGMEVRPPFPKGYVVEQGDWSILDPVRARSPFYRRVP